ncbi:Nitroreductase [Desulfuromusa kysingii]|uniref:Nitroreductase n=1 Tax=Desulfuromusa kysingii TaxID=37625 RepID=A0A1H3XLG4_9BACT|nr:nitroreductase family protein [Desulfuromusa kysingii]SEA00267.1 Nitroreductase [Desulfuromusa kysingii]
MIDLLRQRRSIRKFKPQPIEDEKIAQLSEALLRAPTSKNQQPCEFVLVDDVDILTQLASAKKQGAAFFTSAPLAVVIAANPEVSDVWVEDSAIAALVVQLAAEELGLKSCWSQLRLRAHDDYTRASDFVRQLIGLPVGMEVAMVVAIGYPAEEKSAHPRQSLHDEKIHHNQFS